MRRAGLRPTKLTNAWVPFVVASTTLVRDGGRVGLVLPAELLQVGYAAQLRDFLLSRFAEITLVTFERLVFDGILQESRVVLRRRRHRPGADPHGCTQRRRRARRRRSRRHRRRPRSCTNRRSGPSTSSTPLRSSCCAPLKQSDTLTRLGGIADVDVGIVTGRNSFFTFTDAASPRTRTRAALRPARLAQHPIVRPGLRHGLPDKRYRRRRIGPGCSTLPRDPTDPALLAHIAAGEAAGVHLGYKCSLRKPWWSTPSLWLPDLFMLRQIHLAPRLTVNAAGATSTDTVHRVVSSRQLRPDDLDPTRTCRGIPQQRDIRLRRDHGPQLWRGHLGAGTPRSRAAADSPTGICRAPNSPRDVDLLLKANEIEKALDVVDRQVLIDGLGWSPDVVAQCRSAWVALRDRRTRRGSR